jgi:hypothetical protein
MVFPLLPLTQEADRRGARRPWWSIVYFTTPVACGDIPSSGRRGEIRLAIICVHPIQPIHLRFNPNPTCGTSPKARK